MPKNTIFCVLLLFACKNNGQNNITSSNNSQPATKEIILAANRMHEYLPLIKNKRIGIVTNQTGIVKTISGNFVHLVDTLLSQKMNVVKVFAPEHGFRGSADAGELIKDDRDTRTGLHIISLYGKNKKPTPEQLNDIDILLFDLQDVGVRFYTYISTLHYVMEAVAEVGLPIIVLDRPNPNGHYVDGPILKPEFKSFVGMHPIPVVYGMTIGEYAQMINGEKWIRTKANLKVIPLENYKHSLQYKLPVRPSPNLPNEIAINLYPSLCLFEGTNISVGRGTTIQFQTYGSPYLQKTDFSFIPHPNFGDKNPKHKGKICYGKNLTKTKPISEINLSWLIDAYQQTKTVKTPFFNDFFDKLAGNDLLRKQIINEVPEEDIRKSWQKDLDNFKKIRSTYLLYE